MTMQRCSQIGPPPCLQAIARRYTWPGKGEGFACEVHAALIAKTAAAMGLHLQLLPAAVCPRCDQVFTPEGRYDLCPTCNQKMREEAERDSLPSPSVFSLLSDLSSSSSESPSESSEPEPSAPDPTPDPGPDFSGGGGEFGGGGASGEF